jgi:hypothetical protein
VANLMKTAFAFAVLFFAVAAHAQTVHVEHNLEYADLPPNGHGYVYMVKTSRNEKVTLSCWTKFANCKELVFDQTYEYEFVPEGTPGAYNLHEKNSLNGAIGNVRIGSGMYVMQDGW